MSDPIGSPISVIRGGKPDDPALGTCDWGNCGQYAVEWRWDDGTGQWLPVCDKHRRCPTCKDRRTITKSDPGCGATDGPFKYDAPCPTCYREDTR